MLCREFQLAKFSVSSVIISLLLISTPSANAARIDVVPNDLLHYYPFDGDANDVIAGNNGVSSNISFISGKDSQAASFNGSSSVIDLMQPFNPIGRDYTIAVWVKVYSKNYQGSYIINTTGPTSGPISHYDALILNFDGNTERYAGYHDSERLCVRAMPGGLDGKWYHIALTHTDGDSMRNEIYINGVLQSDDYIDNPSGGISSAVNETRIGADKVGDYRLDGVLDDLRIYNRVLTTNEIWDLAQVPEPAMLSLLILGGWSMLRRR